MYIVSLLNFFPFVYVMTDQFNRHTGTMTKRTAESYFVKYLIEKELQLIT